MRRWRLVHCLSFSQYSNVFWLLFDVYSSCWPRLFTRIVCRMQLIILFRYLFVIILMRQLRPDCQGLCYSVFLFAASLFSRDFMQIYFS